MGYIKYEVQDCHLNYHPDENAIIQAFLTDFDVTWAASRKAYNTTLSLYFLKPLTHVSDLFGFELELALVLHKYDSIEPRTLQAAEQILSDSPAKGRIDPAIYFIYSESINVKSDIKKQVGLSDYARIPVVFCKDDIDKWRNDNWTIRNVIMQQIFSKNLFDSKLPVENDLFFFGRDILITDYLHALKQSQNRGLFGLRKTGKTSIMFKLRRILSRDSNACLLYYDCKDPEIRSLSWKELLEDIEDKICNFFSIKKQHNSKSITTRLRNMLIDIPEKSYVGVIFDEIEYISYIATLDKHWQQDFIPFWQTIWSLQSQLRKLSTIIVGVNPTIVETDLISGIQNPVFGIVQSSYLQGFSLHELSQMTNFFGKRMGLKFNADAVKYLVNRYGGHPLLTRLACGHVHKSALQNKYQRPLVVTVESLKQDEYERDQELIYYCTHIVSELKVFYSDEYEMLEMLAEGDVLGFIQLQNENEFIRHLLGYGLVDYTSTRTPYITIPVLQEHIANDIAKKNKRVLKKYIIKKENRDKWVLSRCESIISDLRILEKIINDTGKTPIFGESSFFEPEKFINIATVSKRDDFILFINTCNRCFIEPIERYGKHQGIKDYFWTTIKLHYLDLWNALGKIKTYRHHELHIELVPNFEKMLSDYLADDLEGKKVHQVEDGWFILQQRCLDSLFLAIQCELNKLT